MQYAALIDVGNSPLIGLLVLILVVGIVVFLALWVFDHFVAAIMADPFRSAARALIIIIAVLIVLVQALRVIFGIELF